MFFKSRVTSASIFCLTGFGCLDCWVGITLLPALVGLPTTGILGVTIVAVCCLAAAFCCATAAFLCSSAAFCCAMAAFFCSFAAARCSLTALSVPLVPPILDFNAPTIGADILLANAVTVAESITFPVLSEICLDPSFISLVARFLISALKVDTIASCIFPSGLLLALSRLPIFVPSLFTASFKNLLSVLADMPLSEIELDVVVPCWVLCCPGLWALLPFLIASRIAL